MAPPPGDHEADSTGSRVLFEGGDQARVTSGVFGWQSAALGGTSPDHRNRRAPLHSPRPVQAGPDRPSGAPDMTAPLPPVGAKPDGEGRGLIAILARQRGGKVVPCCGLHQGEVRGVQNRKLVRGATGALDRPEGRARGLAKEDVGLAAFPFRAGSSVRVLPARRTTAPTRPIPWGFPTGGR